MFFFAELSSISKTPQSKVAFTTFFKTLKNNIKAHKDKYNYESNIELFAILPKNIMTMHSKTFVKTKDLAYFSNMKKYSKI